MKLFNMFFNIKRQEEEIFALILEYLREEGLQATIEYTNKDKHTFTVVLDSPLDNVEPVYKELVDKLSKITIDFVLKIDTDDFYWDD